jgi:hypothetical protein
MITFTRALVLGLVVATFALAAAVLMATIALDALHVGSVDISVGFVEIFTFMRDGNDVTAGVGLGAPAICVVLAVLNALGATGLAATSSRRRMPPEWVFTRRSAASTRGRRRLFDRRLRRVALGPDRRAARPPRSWKTRASSSTAWPPTRLARAAARCSAPWCREPL